MIKSNKKNENLFFIRILQWADGRDSFYFDDIKNEIEMNEFQSGMLEREIHMGRLFGHNCHSVYLATRKDNKVKLWMTIDDKFRLLDYIELQEARRSSKVATWFAAAALVVSIVIGATSIYLQLKG